MIPHAAEMASPDATPRSDNLLRTLFVPIGSLLASGGDARLRIDPQTKLNGYGCRPFPRPEALTFASSTATSISKRAYRRAEDARRDLIEASLSQSLEHAFGVRVERMRDALRAHLGVGADVEVIFSPSGTDSQLHALFIARALLGPRITSVVVAADETGSGTPFTACGRHFADRTAQDVAVAKGMPLASMAAIDPPITIALRDEKGHIRRAEEIDARTYTAVANAVGSGRSVLLHVMDRSKFGWRTPSQGCIKDVCARWPHSVQVVVDACQMRLGRARIRQYLAYGYMVLVTGSKFFTGAPFSGALLVPSNLSDSLSRTRSISGDLGDYSNRSDWPSRWPAIRSGLPPRLNFGQWLRWEAALEEIGAYFAVPKSFRRTALETFAAKVTDGFAQSQSLELLPDQAPDPSDDIDDEEMAVRTIFPFAIRPRGRALPAEAYTKLYQALNRDVSRVLPPGATAAEKKIAATLCHIGQPVVLRGPQNETTAALRISAGARIISESWSLDEPTAKANVAGEIAEVGTILEKIELLLKDC